MTLLAIIGLVLEIIGFILMIRSTIRLTGQGLNPTGSVPAKSHNTAYYANHTSSADNVIVFWHECFPDNSCYVGWSNGQIDKSRRQEEGSILAQIEGGGEIVL